jgi:site-specific DNA-methyltransferase (adenine-specific)
MLNKSLINKKLCMDGLELLDGIDCEEVDACIFDPQYRGIMDSLDYGNEGARQKGRALLQQMSDVVIVTFLTEITRVLKPSCYLFLWIDKYILCEGSHKGWFEPINLPFLTNHKPVMNLVDSITWDKQSFGMGYRSRKSSEYLLIYQKSPKTIKSWKDKSIRDVWSEKILHPRLGHPHKKPIELTTRLINSVTELGDIILDPCAGSFSTFDACKLSGRQFIGCDINPEYGNEIIH